MPTRGRTDAIVVGAGLSGLIAALRLHERGASVQVIEARDRVGGRTLSVPLGNGVVDMGGQWLSPTQHRLAALAEQLEVPTFAQHRHGAMILAGHARPTNLISRLPVVHALELAYRIRQLDRMSNRVPETAPASAPGAADRDSITVADWLRAHVRTDQARDALTLLTHLHFAAEPSQLSLLYFLHALRVTSGLTGRDSLGPADHASGARELRFVGGAQTLCRHLAARLEGAVLLGRPVTRIEHTGDAVAITCEGDGGRSVHTARFAILALAPGLIRRIAVHPAFPPRRDQLGRSMTLAPVIKAAVAYQRPFWRDAGLSGEAYQPGGAVCAVVDCSSPRNAQPALMAFVVGDAARALSALDRSERRRIVMAELIELFGDDAAAPIDWVEQDWAADPWTPGCVAIMGPGAMISCHAALREPVGRIHFAGTETATRWPSYMDGAIEAGERAAAEVIERLG